MKSKGHPSAPQGPEERHPSAQSNPKMGKYMMEKDNVSHREMEEKAKVRGSCTMERWNRGLGSDSSEEQADMRSPHNHLRPWDVLAWAVAKGHVWVHGPVL